MATAGATATGCVCHEHLPAAAAGPAGVLVGAGLLQRSEAMSHRPGSVLRGRLDGREDEMSSHPIDDGAYDLLFRLSEQTEDIMDEVCSELWPEGEDDWFAPPLNAPELPRHSFSEHTYAAVMRRFAELILAAAAAAERRGGPRPVEWKALTPLQTADAKEIGLSDGG